MARDRERIAAESTYPFDEAATIAVREVRAFLDTHDLPERVLLVAYDPAIVQALATKLPNQ